MTIHDFLILSLRFLALSSILGLAVGLIDIENEDDDDNNPGGGTLIPCYATNK